MTARLRWKNLKSRLWAGLDAPVALLSQFYVFCRLSPVAVASNVRAWHGCEPHQCRPSCPQRQKTSEVAGSRPSRNLTPPKRGDSETANSGYSEGILGAFKPNTLARQVIKSSSDSPLPLRHCDLSELRQLKLPTKCGERPFSIFVRPV